MRNRQGSEPAEITQGNMEKIGRKREVELEFDPGNVYINLSCELLASFKTIGSICGRLDLGEKSDRGKPGNPGSFGKLKILWVGGF